MSIGKYLSLEEVRRDPRLLGRFIKERVLGGYGKTNKKRFDGTLVSMIRNSPAGDETSHEANGANCSETRTRQGISEGASD